MVALIVSVGDFLTCEAHGYDFDLGAGQRAVVIASAFSQIGRLSLTADIASSLAVALTRAGSRNEVV